MSKYLLALNVIAWGFAGYMFIRADMPAHPCSPESIVSPGKNFVIMHPGSISSFPYHFRCHGPVR